MSHANRFMHNNMNVDTAITKTIFVCMFFLLKVPPMCFLFSYNNSFLLFFYYELFVYDGVTKEDLIDLL